MERQSPYFNQVALLVHVMPEILESHCFALKGGTAINLFYRDMPRLSVDIDLVYLPLAERVFSLEEISREFEAIADRIRILIPQVKIQFSRLHKSKYITRLLLESNQTLIEKINSSLNVVDKQFLLGFKEGNPDWSYFSVPHIKDLPAVMWKQYNLQKIPLQERKRMIEELARHFEKYGSFASI